MNEIKKIHLGRQAFTISVDAHRALKEYVDAIDRQADAEVVKEVELRMAELLLERKITEEKVVLPEDIDFLKEQLGEPGDFKDEDADDDSDADQNKAKKETDETVKANAPKQLYRDPENGMIAGVAAGVAAYLNIDVVLVRILFVLLALASGAGIVLYLLIWILAPEAKTSSDRLKMRGKAVTVDSIKAVVDRADIPGAASRAGNTVGRGAAKIAMVASKILLAILGVTFAIMGFGLVFGALAGGLGLLTHGVKLGQDLIFPISGGDHVAVALAMTTVLLIGVFLLLIGVAMMRRKWKVPGWVVASLAGVLVVSASAATAYGLNSVSQIQAQIKEARHSKTQSVDAFKRIELTGNAHFFFKHADTYSVEYTYLGKRDESSLKPTVDKETLKFDTTEFQSQGTCRGFCPYEYNDPRLTVTIFAPSLDQVVLRGFESHFTSQEAWRQDNLVIEADRESTLNLTHMNPSEVRVNTEIDNGTTRRFELIGLQRAALRNDTIFASQEAINVDRTDRMILDTNQPCAVWSPLVYLGRMPNQIVLNGKTFSTTDDLRAQHTEEGRALTNCVDVQR
ncbi:MAG TPA: PspC domain-containing protein [Candidatus Saccharimonadales bacterium]